MLLHTRGSIHLTGMSEGVAQFLVSAMDRALARSRCGLAQLDDAGKALSLAQTHTTVRRCRGIIDTCSSEICYRTKAAYVFTIAAYPRRQKMP